MNFLSQMKMMGKKILWNNVKSLGIIFYDIFPCNKNVKYSSKVGATGRKKGKDMRTVNSNATSFVNNHDIVESNILE